MHEICSLHGPSGFGATTSQSIKARHAWLAICVHYHDHVWWLCFKEPHSKIESVTLAQMAWVGAHDHFSSAIGGNGCSLI
jgi:hypothetical protein